MTDQTNSIGAPMDSDELEDPGTNDNAPDPLLGETPKSGALAAVGSKNDQQGRVTEGREAMRNLREQYAGAAGQANDAYAQQKKALQDATQRLLAMQYGPTPQEAAYRVAAAVGTGDSAGRYNPAGISAAHADILKEQREAEVQKQNLLQQYGMQIPQASLGAASARMSQITQQERIQQSENNNAENKAAAPVKSIGKYFMPNPADPTGAPIFNQQMYDTDMQANKDKADINAKAKVWAQQAAIGEIAPEAVNYVVQNQQTPPGFSRNPAAVGKLWMLAHQQNLANGNDVAAAYAHAQANKAMVPALAAISKQQNMLGAFEANAEKNAQMALDFSGKVDRTGTPLFNRWLQSGRTALTGDVDASNFQAANNTFVAEYAKIMSGSMGNQATTDAASKHAQDMLNTAMTKEQYAGVVATLRQEMHNRMSTLESQRQSMLQSMGTQQPQQQQQPVRPGQQPGAGWSIKPAGAP